ncbi:PLP-dependent transferase [Streptomyces sp. NPDC093099]|uniref:PLP-dependent transferase n=1 Tax=Streptomyces sp. NPDC093099 TaxID=3366028 RepID=UPI003813C8F0
MVSRGPTPSSADCGTPAGRPASGGVESLAVHPASMWRGMLSEEQIAVSVPPGLVRPAAGTEDTADVVADALAAADALLDEAATT